MRIALAQIASSTDPDANLSLIREWAQRAKDADAELVTFPEATMASFATRSAAVAQPLDGPWARGVQDVAREVGIAIVAGMFTPGSAGKARNTIIAVDATGTRVAAYDKMHLYDAWGFQESRHLDAGDQPALFSLGGVTFGIVTCYEVRFPELFKHLANAGAEVILVPTSWANGPSKVDQWRTLCLARALDSTCFVLAAGQADPTTVGFEVKPGSPTGAGHSMAVGPLGQVLAEGGPAPELLVIDVNPADLPEARGQLPVLATSRLRISVD